MKNLSNKELVVLAQAGNQKATSILFEKMRNKMMYIMSTKFSNVSNETKEDCVQEALIKAFLKLDKYNPTYSFSIWLSKICTNTVIDTQRKLCNKVVKMSIDHSTKNHEGDDSPTLGSLLQSHTMNPQEMMENSEKAEFALSILTSERFNEKILEIAQMRYVDQLSHKEIVELTNYPEGTIKSNLFRFDKTVKVIANQNTMCILG